MTRGLPLLFIGVASLPALSGQLVEEGDYVTAKHILPSPKLDHAKPALLGESTRLVAPSQPPGRLREQHRFVGTN
jgi:hypothetical protein